MEDFFPLLIFIIVIAVNVVRFIAQQKLGSPPSKGSPPTKKASPLEEFLQEIADKIEPKPREIPKWPEEIQRPDYVQEMHEFEQGKPQTAHHRQPKKEPVVSAPPMPPSLPEIPLKIQEQVKVVRSIKPTSYKISVKGMYIPGMRFPQSGQAPILRSATGETAFDLNSRDNVKKALIAQMVFSKPRAYETSFDNTIAL